MNKPQNPFQQSVLEMHPMNQVPYHVGHSMGLLNVNPQHDLYCSATEAMSYRLFHQGWSDGRVLAESRPAPIELLCQPVLKLADRVATAVCGDRQIEGYDVELLSTGVLGPRLSALVTEMAGHEAEAFALQDQVDEANSSVTALEQQIAELQQDLSLHIKPMLGISISEPGENHVQTTLRLYRMSKRRAAEFGIPEGENLEEDIKIFAEYSELEQQVAELERYKLGFERLSGTVVKLVAEVEDRNERIGALISVALSAEQEDKASASASASVTALEQRVAELEGQLRGVLESGDGFRSALEFHNGDGFERQAGIAATLAAK